MTERRGNVVPLSKNENWRHVVQMRIAEQRPMAGNARWRTFHHSARAREQLRRRALKAMEISAELEVAAAPGARVSAACSVKISALQSCLKCHGLTLPRFCTNLWLRFTCLVASAGCWRAVYWPSRSERWDNLPRTCPHCRKT